MLWIPLAPGWVARSSLESHAMRPSNPVPSCLLACVCLSLVSAAWAAKPVMEQTDETTKGAFLLHEGGNMHTDQQALRERRAKAFELEQREAYDELMAAKYQITQKYLARLPAAEREAMQAELAKQHATFKYRYPKAYEKMTQDNPHASAAGGTLD